MSLFHRPLILGAAIFTSVLALMAYVTQEAARSLVHRIMQD
ncbi:MAG: hypothetical protein QF909_10635 [SAR202 cluster bacterium]|jgi:hypothetical protein|nr:hypothetical protein [SAR202 cluster bacterium]MDP7225640.1 hypothetical protein [SAR202 cluster bacterium]